MEHANKKQFASFEAAGAVHFGDLLSQRPAAMSLKVGVLGLGYFEYWRMYPELESIVERDLAAAMTRLQTALADDAEVCYSGMVDTLDKARAAGLAFQAAGVQLVVVIAGTYLPDFITLSALESMDQPPELVLFNTQTGRDLSPDDTYMDTMRNSSLIGISQLTGSFHKMRMPYDVVVGEITDSAAYERIRFFIRCSRTVRNLRRKTYGLIGHVFRGMFDLEFDRAKVKGFLGPEVMSIQLDNLLQLWEQVDDAEADVEAERLFRRFPAKNVAFDDVRRSVKVGLAMRQLYDKYRLDGLCFLGQHYLEKITGAPARMGASLLLEQQHALVACEGDIGGLVMMDLLHSFTGAMPFQAEWGQFDEAHNAIFLLGHGIGVPQLAESDQQVTLTRSPEEWGFKGAGLNYQLILKPGVVTMGHFLNTGDSWQMLISRGEAVDFPGLPCDELHALIRVKTPVRSYLEQLLTAGSAHHLVVVHGDVAAELAQCAKLMRIETLILE